MQDNNINVFHNTLPVSEIFGAIQLKEGFARVKYTVSNKGFCVVTGTPGVGKSTLIRMLESHIDKSKYIFCYINETDLKPKVLYSRLLLALSVQPLSFLDRVKKQFKDAISELYVQHNKLLILVIDNAQDLPDSTIAEFRYLVSFELDSLNLIPVILVGHTELWDTLKLRKFQSLQQCISSHYRMTPLDDSQTKEYILHHLKIANIPMCFPDDVIKKIFQYTHGIPRIVNNVCRYCLLVIKSSNQDIVDTDVLNKVLNELQY